MVEEHPAIHLNTHCSSNFFPHNFFNPELPLHKQSSTHSTTTRNSPRSSLSPLKHPTFKMSQPRHPSATSIPSQTPSDQERKSSSIALTPPTPPRILNELNSHEKTAYHFSNRKKWAILTVVGLCQTSMSTSLFPPLTFSYPTPPIPTPILPTKHILITHQISTQQSTRTPSPASISPTTWAPTTSPTLAPAWHGSSSCTDSGANCGLPGPKSLAGFG